MISHPLNDQLNDLHKLLHRLQTQDYVFRSVMLGNISMGQHIRHIIELIQCLQQGYDEGCINYENRKRDFRIETDLHFAIGCIEDCIHILILKDRPLLLIQDNDLLKSVNTSYYRELIYNSEHAIHHMALIRVALREMNLDLVSKHFGVAPATIKHQEKVCAQ
ncbi:MAG: hypothetical protein ABIN89_09910 [Chitinophagaceae bacterium]